METDGSSSKHIFMGLQKRRLVDLMNNLTLSEEQPQRKLVQVLRSEKFNEREDSSMELENDFDKISSSEDGHSEALSLRLADTELSSQMR